MPDSLSALTADQLAEKVRSGMPYDLPKQTAELVEEALRRASERDQAKEKQTFWRDEADRYLAERDQAVRERDEERELAARHEQTNDGEEVCSCDRTYHDWCPDHGVRGQGLGSSGKSRK